MFNVEELNLPYYALTHQLGINLKKLSFGQFSYRDSNKLWSIILTTNKNSSDVEQSSPSSSSGVQFPVQERRSGRGVTQPGRDAASARSSRQRRRAGGSQRSPCSESSRQGWHQRRPHHRLHQIRFKGKQ